MHSQGAATETVIVEEQQHASDTPHESANTTPAVVISNITNKVPEQDVDLAMALRSMDERLISIQESLQGMQGIQRVLQDNLLTNRQILQV